MDDSDAFGVSKLLVIQLQEPMLSVHFVFEDFPPRRFNRKADALLGWMEILP
ncbi:MAG: hypothetical protein J0L70_26495 [Leptolyngbya sp. UWPOB_LEPTO1]|uniref:hypothetical protein n=1 Tax=Leptolyngbya sp. UWPOB_LEPTO1 TaxID=2815653 RepID=UPI001AC4E4B5|nr:hypothetical protein [Leptolyngbya sp. UWPOB_LEPTO1]MBN8564090.1 hypothetical protein [Leptolyngbya sp. UWPOB_LEPTO1]